MSFEHSPTLGKLFAALSKAQAEMEGAKRDSENPFFHSQYADLASVLKACRPLFKNGLSILQPTDDDQGGSFVWTIIGHAESGEWMRSRTPIKALKEDPQAYGSALTYSRRYGLQSMVGLASESDDDGEAAIGRETSANRPPARRGPPARVRERKPGPIKPCKHEWDVSTGGAAPIGTKICNLCGQRKDDEIPMYNGPKHIALAKRLEAEGISEQDFMAAGKLAGLIPQTAKAFRLMTEKTAAGFFDNPDIVDAVLKLWRERPNEQTAA